MLCTVVFPGFLMFTTSGWAEAATSTVIICYAMAYGGFAQMVAGVLELIKGNTFAGTAFFSYGECNF
jgi:succinate-acetate transporter protein